MAMGHFPNPKNWYSLRIVMMIKHSIEQAFAMMQSVSLDSERRVDMDYCCCFSDAPDGWKSAVARKLRSRIVKSRAKI